MTKFISLATLTLTFCILNSIAVADLGGNHMIANNLGRCWRVIHRDFTIKGNATAGYMFKVTNVGGTGLTDDILSYELKVKQDYQDGVGWDETKTVTLFGTGLIKSISDGKVRFEIYIDQGPTEDPLTIQGYYHPGVGSSDSDDRVILSLPPALGGSDCDETEILEEGTEL